MNLGKIAKQVLSTVAPLAATAIGGPVGGVVSSLVKNALGVTDDDQVDAALAEGSPETLLKLKTLDKDLRVKLRELDIEEQSIYLDDKQDARELAKSTGKIWPQYSICCALTVLVATVIFLLFWMEIPSGAKEVMYMILGALIREWGASISFFVGTTRSSQAKTGLIGRQS